MAVLPNPPINPGDLVTLDATGKLPPIDGSQLTNLTAAAATPTGNVVWVDKINGNDGTGVRGQLDKPFLTIQAGIDAAVAGDVVYVLPGTYIEQIVCKDDVSVLGIDRRQCILEYSGASSVTVITMAQRILVTNFDLKLNPTGGTTIGILFPGVTNANSAIIRVNVNVNVTGNVIGTQITGTGVVNPGRGTIRQCNIIGSGTGYGLHLVHGAGTGQSRFDESHFDGPVGVRVETGIGIFDKCNLAGTIGLQTLVGSTTKLEANVAVTAYDAQGTLIHNSFTFPRHNYNGLVDPTITDDGSAGYHYGSAWTNTLTRAQWVCVNPTIGAADWDLIIAPETDELILTPESRVGGNATRVSQTQYNGASFRVSKHMDGANRITVAVTGGTFSPVPTISIALYQTPYGGAGIANLIGYCDLAPTANGTYTIIPDSGPITLQPGLIYILFGRITGTGGSATMRTYTTSNNALINTDVPSGLHPATFITAINASSPPPATFDPRAIVGSAVESSLDVSLVMRVSKV